MIAGVLIGPITYANPYLGDTYGIAGFVALMIGGTERPVGAMVGGLILGLLEEAAKSLINTQASDWFPFVVVVVDPPAHAAGALLGRSRSCVGLSRHPARSARGGARESRRAVGASRIRGCELCTGLDAAVARARPARSGRRLPRGSRTTSPTAPLYLQSLVLVAAVFGILAVSLDLVAGIARPVLARPRRPVRARRLRDDAALQRPPLEPVRAAAGEHGRRRARSASCSARSRCGSAASTSRSRPSSSPCWSSPCSRATSQLHRRLRGLDRPDLPRIPGEPRLARPVR